MQVQLKAAAGKGYILRCSWEVRVYMGACTLYKEVYKESCTKMCSWEECTRGVCKEVHKEVYKEECTKRCVQKGLQGGVYKEVQL